MRTKHRIGGVFDIGLGAVSDFVYYLLGVGTRLIAADFKRHSALAFCISDKFRVIITHRRNRCISADNRGIPECFGRGKSAAHTVYIGHCTSNRVGGKLNRKPVPRFEKDAFGLHQPLSQSTIGCLTEVTALGML